MTSRTRSRSREPGDAREPSTEDRASSTGSSAAGGAEPDHTGRDRPRATDDDTTRERTRHRNHRGEQGSSEQHGAQDERTEGGQSRGQRGNSRGNRNRSGKGRGGQNKGGQNRGSQTKGSHNKGGQGKDGQSKDGQSKDGQGSQGKGTAQGQRKGGNQPRNRSKNQRRKRGQQQRQGAGFWGDPRRLPELRSDVTISEDPAAIPRSLGPPPLPGHEQIAAHYFAAVYDRAVGTAAALAAAGGLIDPDSLVDDEDR